MKQTTRPSSSLSLVQPISWAGLSDEQLRAVCEWSASTNYNIEEVKALLLLHHLVPPTARQLLSADDLLTAIEQLDWLDTPPTTPIRCEQLHGRDAVDAALHGVSFEHYLIAENCFQGWLATLQAAPLQDMAAILYPDSEEQQEALPPLTAGECYGIALWWTGVKSLFAATFTHLFRTSAQGETDSPDLTEAMNAQIRALTAGDITKEACVLSTDCHRALTELNAKAREAQELSSRLNA